jgi:hypothetical protein
MREGCQPALSGGQVTRSGVVFCGLTALFVSVVVVPGGNSFGAIPGGVERVLRPRRIWAHDPGVKRPTFGPGPVVFSTITGRLEFCTAHAP